MLDMPVPISPFDIPLTPILDITSPRPPPSDSTPSISTIISHSESCHTTRQSVLRVDCAERSSKLMTRSASLDVQISARETFYPRPLGTSAPGPIVSLSSDVLSPPIIPRAHSFHFVDDESKPHTLRRRPAQIFVGSSEETSEEAGGCHSLTSGVDAQELMRLLKIQIPVGRSPVVGSGGMEEGMKMLRETVRKNEFDIQFLSSVIILLCVLLAGLVALLAAET